MTTATPESVPKNLAVLRLQLGNDNADAVASYVESSIDALFLNGGVLSGLRQVLIDLHDRYGDQPELSEAAANLRQTTESHNDAVLAAQQGTVDPVVVETDTERTNQVREEIVGTGRTLEERMGDVEAILAVNYDGERPPSRFDQIEADIITLRSHTDQALRGSQEALSVSARAIAIARAAGGDGGRLRFASQIALAVFGVIAILYFLIFVWPGSPDWTLRDQFAWPFGLGAVAFWLGLVFWPAEQEATAEAQAEAEADRRHDEGLGIVRSDDRATTRSARADAHASA